MIGALLGTFLRWAIPAGLAYLFLRKPAQEKKPPQPSALPPTITPQPQITKEQFEAIKNRIKSMLNQQQTQPAVDYFSQALALPATFLEDYAQRVKALGKVTKRQAAQLRRLASAIPLVSQSGLGYWNQALVNSLENRISALMTQAIPTEMTWDSLLRAKYARRTLQTLLPTYTRLVSATRYALTPSPVAPNLLTQAMKLETLPQTTILSALPPFYEQKQKALLGAGEAQARASAAQMKQRMSLLDTLLRNRANLEATALRVLGNLGTFDPTIKALALRYLQPTTGALQW